MNDGDDYDFIFLQRFLLRSPETSLAYRPRFYILFESYIDETIRRIMDLAVRSSCLHGGCYERVALLSELFASYSLCSLSDTNFFFSSCPSDSLIISALLFF